MFANSSFTSQHNTDFIRCQIQDSNKTNHLRTTRKAKHIFEQRTEVLNVELQRRCSVRGDVNTEWQSDVWKTNSKKTPLLKTYVKVGIEWNEAWTRNKSHQICRHDLHIRQEYHLGRAERRWIRQEKERNIFCVLYLAFSRVHAITEDDFDLRAKRCGCSRKTEVGRRISEK